MLFKKLTSQRMIELLVDPKSNKRIVGLTTYAILAVVSAVMTLMNIITQKGALTLATAVFAVLCAVDWALTFRGNEKLMTVSYNLFSIELIGLFTFFLLSGNPEGFSAIWICMAPPIGMLFFNLKNGTIFCSTVFAELVFFLWTPMGRDLLPPVYTDSFLSRFPLLYLAFFCLAFFLQFLRDLTWGQLDKTNKILEEQATHDQLTGLYNRQGLFDIVKKRLSSGSCESFGAIIFDIDHFKRINDAHGHDVGDIVLVRFAEILGNGLHADVGRWGGEEFAAFFCNDDVKPEDLNAVLKAVENEAFKCRDFVIHITCSAGVCEMPSATFADLGLLVQNADRALYASKEAGRNRVSYLTAPKVSVKC